MSGHGGLRFDPLHVIGHHPCNLKVPIWLPLSNQIHSNSWTNLRYHKDEHLVHIINLSWELIPLVVGPIANALEFGGAIHYTEPPQIFERGNLRAKNWGSQLSTTLKQRFEFF